METRKCSKCGVIHPLTEEYFRKNQSTNTGGDKYFRPECKKCTSKVSTGKDKAYKLAGNPERPPLGTPCDLCTRTDKTLVFDHCHKTLVHRGWLCQSCNRSLGMRGDDIDGMLESAIYIAKNTNVSLNAVSDRLFELWK
tara:strand:+ start:140 stop:556 length:417 start_codon:yes stop_codon:yes gene_type:complete